ncbi:MAG: hypothetical protein OEZ44_00750 [Candidatus Bathyarchaeota archaeon]|nr:hypothetical protein [Candidatus Bathyarchaeota archaeon]
MGMYSCSGEHDTEPEILSQIIEKYERMLQNPDDFPTILAGPYAVASDFGHKVLLIVEADSDAKMIRLARHFYPFVRLNWTPIYHIRDVWKDLLK